MNATCYKAYHWLKQTWIASYLVYHGERFYQTSAGAVTVTGVVTEVASELAEDGDFNFDLYVPADRWEYHCEITPVVRNHLAAFMRQVRAGDQVKLTGTVWYDPPHTRDDPDVSRTLRGGWMEIRPTAAEVLS